ncbi:hypothetical protein BE18_06400 [Sorangium cellulosum]|uniref:Uncharacterized protein n=1 Tax=Sorangium cellulosum TaxID=56 RepID=A0A150SBW1_SORCE|nr:hypothetical protein BE18_06400 [Sorangium cellulosum]
MSTSDGPAAPAPSSMTSVAPEAARKRRNGAIRPRSMPPHRIVRLSDSMMSSRSGPGDHDESFHSKSDRRGRARGIGSPSTAGGRGAILNA